MQTSALTCEHAIFRYKRHGEPTLLRFAEQLLQQLKTLYPLLGCRQMAGWLARAGLHLSATTIRRRLNKPVQLPRRPKHVPFLPKKKPETARTVIAKYPGHIWNCDITTVPTSWGLAISWLGVLPFGFILQQARQCSLRCALAGSL